MRKSSKRLCWPASDPFRRPLACLARKQIQTLATCHFIEHGENVVLLGPPGVGKTHLAVGLGLKAIEHGYPVLFTTAASMIPALNRPVSQNPFAPRPTIYPLPPPLFFH